MESGRVRRRGDARVRSSRERRRGLGGRVPLGQRRRRCRRRWTGSRSRGRPPAPVRGSAVGRSSAARGSAASVSWRRRRRLVQILLVSRRGPRGQQRQHGLPVGLAASPRRRGPGWPGPGAAAPGRCPAARSRGRAGRAAAGVVCGGAPSTAAHWLRVAGPEDHPRPGVLPHRVAQQRPALSNWSATTTVTLAARPCRSGTWSSACGSVAAVGGREMGERARAVEQDPQRAPGVLRRGMARLPCPVRRDQPPLGLVRRPLQRGQRPGQPALHRQHAVPSGQAGVLAGAAAVDDQHVAVLQRLERDRAQQGGGAAARLAHGEQVRLGGAGAGTPDHRRRVPLLLPVGDRQGALDRVGVGEAEHRLARGGDEALGGDVGGQRRPGRSRRAGCPPRPRRSGTRGRGPTWRAAAARYRARDSASPSVKYAG